MGYGQVNVGGSSSKVNLVSLFNNDSRAKHISVATSESLQTTATTNVNYGLFTYTFSDVYDNTIKLQGSNDNLEWTDIKSIRLSSHKAETITGTTNGYTYYRIYSRCAGDDYSPRSTNSGIISTSPINLTIGNTQN